MSTTTLDHGDRVADRNRWYLSAAPIARALVHLCVPMAAAMVVSAVYNVINAGFIGSQHDTSLLAAITFGTPLLGLVMAVGGVFGVGGSALMSRMLGASEHEPDRAQDIKHVAAFSLWGACSPEPCSAASDSCCCTHSSPCSVPTPEPSPRRAPTSP